MNDAIGTDVVDAAAAFPSIGVIAVRSLLVAMPIKRMSIREITN
ncbi:MAG TPA: hypothetical protein VHI13_11650 [Candidatus Kapabacteria bacterium]|nr:hypothetical protein [Candidatus Kapabacteria bacterium]